MADAVIEEQTEAVRERKRSMLIGTLDDWNQVAERDLYIIAQTKPTSLSSRLRNEPFLLGRLVYPENFWFFSNLSERSNSKTRQRMIEHVGTSTADMLAVSQDKSLHNLGDSLELLAQYLSQKGIPCTRVPSKNELETPFLVFSLEKITEENLQTILTGFWEEHVLPKKQAKVDAALIEPAIRNNLDRASRPYFQKDPFGRLISTPLQIESFYTQAIAELVNRSVADGVSPPALRRGIRQAIKNIPL